MAADLYFEVVRPPENSALTLKHFIRCLGGLVPTWVEHCAKPFDAEIPPNRPVFDVDLRAEMQERAAAEAAFQQPDLTRLTNSETMQYLNWTEADYCLARDLFNFPKNDAYREDAGVWIGGGAGEPTRRREAIDRWLEDSRTKIATLERLIGATEKRGVRGFFNKR